MPRTSESGGCTQAAKASRSAQEKPVDEQLPTHQPGKDSAVRYSIGAAGASGKKQSVGRAKPARPASRLIYPKTAARELHQSRISTKNQNPQNGQHWARFDWGFGAFCFGASPVAAVFGSAPGSATSPKHHSQTKPSSQNPPAKPDISTLRRIEHFYFALTCVRRVGKQVKAPAPPELRFSGTADSGPKATQNHMRYSTE